MTDSRVFREVSSATACAFATGKTIAEMSDGWQSTTTLFTDGSAMRITLEEGAIYSEYSSDPARIIIEISP